MLNTSIKKDIQNQFRSSIYKYLFENMNLLDGQIVSTKNLMKSIEECEKIKGYHEMKTPQNIASQINKIFNSFGPQQLKIAKINVR